MSEFKVCKECGWVRLAPEGGCSICDGNMVGVTSLYDMQPKPTLKDGQIECDLCDARKHCDKASDESPTFNPYFRTCHDHGFLTKAEGK